MFRDLFRATAGLLLLACLLPMAATAASFKIESFEDLAALKGTSPPDLPATFIVATPGTTTDWTADLEGNPSWASLSTTSGSGAGSLTISFNTTALATGTYNSALTLNSGGTVSKQILTLKVVEPQILKMQADLNRPVIYALSRRPEGDRAPSFMIFLNSGTGKAEKVLPLGEYATDFDFSGIDQALYVSLPGYNSSRILVVDPVSRTLPRALTAGSSVIQVKAGLKGRVITQSVYERQLLNSTSGALIKSTPGYSGGGVSDPTGRFFYHTIDMDSILFRYDLSKDDFSTRIASARESGFYTVPVISGDGQHIFWSNGLYTPDLIRTASFDSPACACTYRGDLVFGESKVYQGRTGEVISSLGVTSPVMAVSGDQKFLYQFDDATRSIVRTAIAPFGEPEATTSTPDPQDNSHILLPLDRLRWTHAAGAVSYQVYLGTDAPAVALAGTDSSLYLGETDQTEKTFPGTLMVGTSYYWRLDALRPGIGKVTGPVWKFTPSALSVSPDALTLRYPRGMAPVTSRMTVGGDAAWTASASVPWLSLSPSSGHAGDTLQVTADPAGLPPGVQTGSVNLTSAGVTVSLPVSLELFHPVLVRMIADPVRPVIYALHAGQTGGQSYVMVISTASGRITEVLPVGTGASDFTINRQEDKLYVSNWGQPVIQAVDLDTRTVLTPIPSGTDIYKLNAGRAGRLYTEGFNQWVSGQILNSATGTLIAGADIGFRAGDAEIDPAGVFYYHCDDNISDAHITKLDVRNDKWNQVTTSTESSGFGSRNLVLSADGTRLFWTQRVYGDDLKLIRDLGEEIFSTSARGELAVSDRKILNASNGVELATLPVSTNVSIFTADQTALFYFDPASKTIGSLSMEAIAPKPGKVQEGLPANGGSRLAPLASLSWDAVAAAVRYEVYFGTSAEAVAKASPASSEYAGSTIQTFWNLPPAAVPPGGTFYWRVDAVGITGTSTGAVSSFRTLPATLSPASVTAAGIQAAPPQVLSLPVTGLAGASWTASTSGAAWLRVLTPSGSTGGNLELEVSAGSLTPGTHTAGVSFTSDGLSDSIPVIFTVEALKCIALKADPVRPRLYGIHRPASLAGTLVVFDSETGSIVKTVALSSDPGEMDLTPDNRFLYAVTRGGRKMHRVNLEDWSTASQPLAETQDSLSSSDSTVFYRVAAGAGSMVYWVDGLAAPMLHFMDFATGRETAEAMLADGTTGFGSLARSADGRTLITCTQTSWVSPYVESRPVVVDLSGPAPQISVVDFRFARGALKAPIILRPGDAPVFLRQYKLDAGLTTSLKQYPSDVFAATRSHGFVFGATSAWRENTQTQVWQAPAYVDASISAITGDQSAFHYFNSATAKLVKVPLASLGDFPGPLPEDGEVISAMPAALTWTPDPQALRYEIYFGRGQESVQTASGPASPLYLGSSLTASIPLKDQPFVTGALWWWRVDTVLAGGGTVKGPVWKFSGFPEYLTTIPAMEFNTNPDITSTVAMEGATLLIGNAGSQYTKAGFVTVHQKTPGKEEWRKFQTLPRPAGMADEAQFGTALVLKGDTAWIGAPQDKEGGKVYEFRREMATQLWAPTGRSVACTPGKAPAFGGFGNALAFDGTVLVVGIPTTNPGDISDAGAVEIFDASTLARKDRLTESSPGYYRKYGSVLALGNGFLAVGSPERQPVKGPGNISGAVDIWIPDAAGRWTLSTTLEPDLNSAIISFGQSLAVSGDVLFVGVPFSLNFPINPAGGKVFPYRRTTGSAWTALPPVEPPGAPRTDSFSATLAAAGDFLAFGTPSVFGGQDMANPSTWVYHRSSAQAWTAAAPAVRPGKGLLRQMGLSLAVTERYLAVAHGAGTEEGTGVTVYLHNPDGNLPPRFTSLPMLFAEEGRAYQSTFRASDENGDPLSFSATSALPAWLRLKDNGDGTALLSGTPPSGSAGTPALTIAVRDTAGASVAQSFALTVLLPGGLPEITSSTGDLTVNDHKPVTLGVTVSGTPVSYQWYQDGHLMPGQTGASLVISNAQGSDAGSYQVRITRNGAWIDSPPILLDVTQVPDRFGGDWPTFGAGNSHNGAYPATLGLHKFLPAWTVANAGADPVATGQGRVFLTRGGRFTETGNALAAYQLSNGAPVWSTPLTSSVSFNPPTYHRGRAYIQKSQGLQDPPQLICVDAATGGIQWKSRFDAQWESYFAPVVSDEGIFMNGGSVGGVYGFSLEGTELFHKRLDQIDNWTPLLHEGWLYTWVAGIFRQFDPELGTELNQLTLGSGLTASGTIPAAAGNVAVMSSFDGLYAVSLPDMKLLWKRSGQFNGSPAIRNGTAYISGAAGVESFALETGAPGTVFATKGADNLPVMPSFQPVLLEDTLLVSSPDNIWTFDLASGTALQRLTGGGPLTYTDGVLLAVGPDEILRSWKVNQPAVLTAAPAAMAATEDVLFTWKLTVADADGDAPVITTSGKPSWLIMGALTGNSITFRGTPRNADNGAFSFTLTADDQKSVPATLRIEGFVAAVNDAPVGAAAPAPVTANEDSAIPPVKIADLFSDEEDGAAGLTVTIADNSNPSLLASAVISDGQLNLTAAPNAFGSTTLRLVAVDSGGLTAETLVMVTLLPVNDPPVAVDVPTTITVDEDSPITPVPAGHLFGDIDNTEAELKLSVTGNSNPALFTSVTVSRGAQLPVDHVNLVTAPDANGTAVLTITATDPGGLTATKEILVTVRPVNDAPVISGVIPDISAGGAASAAAVNFAPFVKDPDGGDTLTWRVVSNSNPGLFSKLEFDAQGRLNIAYAPYLSGQATVTVEVTDAAGTKAQSTFTVDLPAIPDPSLTASATLTLNRQTGLWEQKVTVKNIGQRAISGFEIAITGLPAKATVYNASGGTDALPVVGYYQPIAAGESLTVMLEYYTPDRATLKPQLTVTAVLPREAAASTAGTIAVDRAVMLEPGAFLLEFPAVPGELYMVQYTDDAGTWRDSLVRLRAGGNRVQWIDRGAPRTSSPPGSGKSRFYRVKHLATP